MTDLSCSVFADIGVERDRVVEPPLALPSLTGRASVRVKRTPERTTRNRMAAEWRQGGLVPDSELRVWLDDLLDDRAAPEGRIHVTSAGAAIALLDTGWVVELSLDHDLGDDEAAGKGVHVIDHLAERQVLEGRDLWPRDGITIHSANAAGASRWRGRSSATRASVTTCGGLRRRAASRGSRSPSGR
jgi:hypothetical protein